MFSGRIGTEPAPSPGRQQMEKAAKGEISCQDQCEIGFSFLGGRPRRGQGCDRAWKKSGLAAVCVLENSRGARSSWVASRTFLPSHAATGFVCLREASLKRMDGLLELKRPGGDGRKGPKKKTTRLFPDVADALEMDTGKRSWHRKRSCPWRPPGSASWARTFSSRCVCTDLLAVTRP